MNETLPLFPREDAEGVERELREHAHQFDYNTREWTIEVLLKLFDDNVIIIPEYQRQFIWPEENKSRFIESVFLEIPVPYLFFAESEATGQLEVVDGVQRISTLRDFVKGDLHLGELEILTSLSEFSFPDLLPSRQRKFLNRSLRAIVIGENATPGAKFDIFSRLNTTAMKLNAAEVRRGAFRGKFQQLIGECAENAKFLTLCRMSGPDTRVRREPEELVLRFFCYAERYREFRHDVAFFLDDYLNEKNKVATDQEIVLWRQRFERMVDFVATHFPYGFVKGPQSQQTPRVRFEAIAVGSHLALDEKPALVPGPMRWLSSDEFKKHVRTHGSNSQRRLRERVEFVRDCLLGVIDADSLTYSASES
jgi:hypothetical protein